jgi:hypothetical protein
LIQKTESGFKIFKIRIRGRLFSGSYPRIRAGPDSRLGTGVSVDRYWSKNPNPVSRILRAGHKFFNINFRNPNPVSRFL